jgi:glycine oxidase
VAEHAHTSDAVVIGGGIIGLAVAWRLAREGLSVTLVEKGSVGRRASWAAAGVLAAGNWQRRDPLVEFQRASLRMYPAFCAEAAEVSGTDPEYVNCGSLELLFEEQRFRMAQAEVDAAMPYRDARGEPVLRLLTAREAKEMIPTLTGEILAAKHCTFNSQVRNPRLLRALAAAARSAGTEIVEDSEVTGLQRQGTRVVGVRSTRDDFAAARTVLCAGAWSSQIDTELERQARVYPVRGQIALLQTAPGELRHMVKHRKSYLVPRKDGQVLVGSTEEHDSGFDSGVTADGVGRVLQQAERMVPPLGRATFVQAWAGLRPGTPDRRPYIGPVPGLDGLITATGHFRTGLGLAPLTAEVVADLVLRGVTKHDISLFQPGRGITT